MEFRSTTIGKISIVIASTNAILAMLEPTILPTATSECPSTTDCKLTKSSGADVPKETTVIPITSGEISNFLAIPTAPLTKKSPLKTSTTSPKIRSPINVIMVIILCL